jgi:hypothetical protein
VSVENLGRNGEDEFEATLWTPSQARAGPPHQTTSSADAE